MPPHTRSVMRRRIEIIAGAERSQVLGGIHANRLLNIGGALLQVELGTGAQATRGAQNGKNIRVLGDFIIFLYLFEFAAAVATCLGTLPFQDDDKMSRGKKNRQLACLPTPGNSDPSMGA